jgi:hypothetical protein
VTAAQRKRVSQEDELLGYSYCGMRDITASHSGVSRLKSFSAIANDFRTYQVHCAATSKALEFFAIWPSYNRCRKS